MTTGCDVIQVGVSAMVQPDKERELDDVILQVFEQAFSYSRTCCRHFYFPVTSQREARAFVVELQRRGVQYAAICAAVGELDENFTSWRTGLNRPSVGNRVVERINRPLQQLLLAADDDDEEDDGLSDVDDDDEEEVLAQFTSSTETRQISSTPMNSRRAEWTRDDAMTSVNDDLTTVSNTDEHSALSITERPRPATCEVVCSENEENNNEASSVAGACSELEAMTIDRQVINKHDELIEAECSSDEVDTAEETHGIQEAAAAVVASVIAGAVDEVVKGRETELQGMSVTEMSSEADESVEQRHIAATSSAADNLYQPPPATSSSRTSPLTCTTSDTVHFTTIDTDHLPQLDGRMTSQPEVETNHTVTATTVTSDCTAELTTTESRPPATNGHVTSQPETKSIIADVVDNHVEPEVVPRRTETARETTANDDGVNVKLSTAEDHVTAKPEVTSPAESEWKCVQRERSTRANKCHDDDVGENYDSDDEHDVSGGRWSRVRRGGRLFHDDGPGYVYVFTDTPTDGATRCRVKISASRRPAARLRQAQLFNLDMRLVTAVKVSHRLEAACLLRERLVDSAIVDTLDWFQTALDVVINSVMDVARLFSSPSTTSSD